MFLTHLRNCYRGLCDQRITRKLMVSIVAVGALASSGVAQAGHWVWKNQGIRSHWEYVHDDSDYSHLSTGPSAEQQAADARRAAERREAQRRADEARRQQESQRRADEVRRQQQARQQQQAQQAELARQQQQQARQQQARQQQARQQQQAEFARQQQQQAWQQQAWQQQAWQQQAWQQQQAQQAELARQQQQQAELERQQQITANRPVQNEMYSPKLGIYFQVVRYNNGQLGARLTRNPVPGSPMNDIQLEAGDTVYALDGQGFMQLSDLESHYAETRVDFVNIRTNRPQAGTVSIP